MGLRLAPLFVMASCALAPLVLAPFLTSRAWAADEECKRIMSGRIKVCADDCQRKALAATDIKDPNNNILFLCIKKCAQDLALQGQLCQ